MASKLGRMRTYLAKLLPIKSHDARIMLSCEITWQIKTIISPLPQFLWPLSMAAWQLTWMGSYPYSHMNLWFLWSWKIRWQTKTIIYPLPQYIWPPNLADWRLTLMGSYQIVTWPLIRWSYVDHATVWKIYISPFTRLTPTKRGRVPTTGRSFSKQTLQSSPILVINVSGRTHNPVKHLKWTLSQKHLTAFSRFLLLKKVPS